MPKHQAKPHKVKRPNKRDLTRYRAFAKAYLAVGQPTYFNAERSALAAGYKPGTAKGSSYKLLDKAGVQEEMRKLRDARAKQSTIASPEEVLEVLTTQIRVLPNVLAGDDGNLIPVNKLTNEQAQAIAGVKHTERTVASGEDVVTERRIEYKLVDRQKAAEILARHHGLFLKHNEQQKPEASVKLVMMPTGDMTLEEWTKQTQAILDKAKHAPAPAQA